MAGGPGRISLHTGSKQVPDVIYDTNSSSINRTTGRIYSTSSSSSSNLPIVRKYDTNWRRAPPPQLLTSVRKQYYSSTAAVPFTTVVSSVDFQQQQQQQQCRMYNAGKHTAVTLVH